MAKAAGGIGKNPYDQSRGKVLVAQVLVNPEELPGLLPRFALLEKVAGTTTAQALKEFQVEVKTSAAAEAVAEIKTGGTRIRGTRFDHENRADLHRLSR